MKLSLNWLRDYVDVTLPPREIAFKLTMAGTEVGGIEIAGEHWDGISVAQITGIERHPNADRLVLATLDLGGGRSQTVVTGAPNVQAGQKVPFAPVGTKLVDGHTGEAMVLKPAKIRGVPSEGMVLSEKELGISDSHEGILVLPDDAPVGQPLREYLGDAILDLELTPNRPDELSVIGIAREVAVLTGKAIREPEVQYADVGEPIERAARVDIEAVDLCPRYAATLIRGVTVGPSPEWLQRRLRATGVRPINNVVDVTNYVMLEYGQPLHAFDFNLLAGRHIIVRRARQGEVMHTLDGQERTLTREMLVIADEARAVAVAGVMGGENSEVAASTTDVLIESANFDWRSIRRTASALRMRTEASARFEKGLPIELPVIALRRATQLMAELTGGAAAPGVIDVYPEPRAVEPVRLPMSEFTRVLGTTFVAEDVQRVLESLGMSVDVEGAGAGAYLTVTPPWWRTDINLKVDVIEEVARVVGYEVLPTTLSLGSLPSYAEDETRALNERVRDLLAAAGLQEVITYSLVSEELQQRALLTATPIPALPLANPMSGEWAYVRTTARGSLLQTLAQNLKHEDGPLQLFEVGRVYVPREGDLPDEQPVLSIVLAGPRARRRWGVERSALDFYDLKGIVEGLLDRLGVRNCDFTSSEDPSLHPGKTATISAGGTRLGVIGEVHPLVAERFEIETAALFGEIDLRALQSVAGGQPRIRPISRFPEVQRDLAVLVDVATPAQDVKRVILESPLLTQVELFDVYAGDRLPEGKKSLAFALAFQAPDRTLTDAEVDRVVERIVGRLSQIGATLRS